MNDTTQESTTEQSRVISNPNKHVSIGSEEEILANYVEYNTQAEVLLKNLVKSNFIRPKNIEGNKFFFLRQFNSFYPSFYDVIGGCYAISIQNELTIIDPGYKTVQALRENGLDTRNIRNIIITHNHGDHIGGILELLDILFQQKSDNGIQFFVNPGMRRVFSQFGREGLTIVEVKPTKKYPLVGDRLHFYPHLVYHKGILNEGDYRWFQKRRRPKSIGLVFEYTPTLGKEYKFGLTGDLDGREQPSSYHLKIFRDLKFLIMHLGSFKQEKPDDPFPEDSKKGLHGSHLHIEGVKQFIEGSSNIEKFVLQEFGMEMANPKELLSALTPLFGNGYYLPYLVLYHKLINRNKLLSRVLGPLFFEFISNLDKAPTRDKFVELGVLLCLSVPDNDSTPIVIEENYWNSWNSQGKAICGIFNKDSLSPETYHQEIQKILASIDLPVTLETNASNLIEVFNDNRLHSFSLYAIIEHLITLETVYKGNRRLCQGNNQVYSITDEPIPESDIDQIMPNIESRLNFKTPSPVKNNAALYLPVLYFLEQIWASQTSKEHLYRIVKGPSSGLCEQPPIDYCKGYFREFLTAGQSLEIGHYRKSIDLDQR